MTVNHRTIIVSLLLCYQVRSSVIFTKTLEFRIYGTQMFNNETSFDVTLKKKTPWASSWDYGTYHIGDQQWDSGEPAHPRSLTWAFASAQSHQRLRIRAVSPEPVLFAHMQYRSRRRVRPKIRHLAPLDGCACVFEEWVYGRQKVP